MLYDYTNQRASLVILDSENFADGPICRIHLRHALAYGLHGSFAATNCGSTGHKRIDVYPSMKVFVWPVDPQFVADGSPI
jgi:hypothetical protein